MTTNKSQDGAPGGDTGYTGEKQPNSPRLDSADEPVTGSSFGMPAPTNQTTAERLAQIDELKYFFATATDQWDHNTMIQRFRLPSGEDVSCVAWDGVFYITGTDIVRSLAFRFHAFGRPVTNPKKFEEGIFSDLRNLKPGSDARLEEPKSEFLDMLYKNNCIRTQKKQKVFIWYSVPHDRLFLDALERDLKREKMDLEPTSTAVAEPATSISLDSTQELFDQLRKSMSLTAAASTHAFESDASRASSQCSTRRSVSRSNGWITPWVQPRSIGVPIPERIKPLSTRRSRVHSVPTPTEGPAKRAYNTPYHHPSNQVRSSGAPRSRVRSRASSAASPQLPGASAPSTPPEPIVPSQSVANDSVVHSKSMDPVTLKSTKAIFGALSLFDGSPTYKQRRRRAASSASASSTLTAAPSLLQAGRPDRVQRQHGCHFRSVTADASNSRLAMAATAAGFHDSNMVSVHPGALMMNWPDPVDKEMTEPDRTYTCTHPACGLVFKQVEHLDHHLRIHARDKPSPSELSSKQFSQSSTHPKPNPLMDQQDGDAASFRAHPFSAVTSSYLSHGWSPTKTLDHGCTCEIAPSQWPTVSASGSICSSRCSSSSPMLDLDMEMHDLPAVSPSHAAGSLCLHTTNTAGLPAPANMSTTAVSRSLPSDGKPALSHTQTMCEDDSSSSSSSPASMLNFAQQTLPASDLDMYGHWMDPAMDGQLSRGSWDDSTHLHPRSIRSTPLALLSPFKPQTFAYNRQPPNVHQNTSGASGGTHGGLTLTFHGNDPSHQSSALYQVVPYGFQVPATFTSFVTPTDVSMALF